MALELVYTSAERGLRPGTSGFCTVAMTRGLPPALVPRLEALGGYRPGPTGREVHFIPVAAETGGRWDFRFERELVCLARERVLKTSDDACTEGGHSAAVCAVLQRWRQEFSCTLMKGCWAVLAACLGATPLDHCRQRPVGLELADHW